MVPELIDKYVFLVQTFIEAGPRGLSLRELQDRWENRYQEAYPRRTFCNHREAVAAVFGIEIACDRSTNRYYIDEGESAVDKRAAMDYLINTFTVKSLLTLGEERLSGRVSVEDIPSGRKYLTTIMEAMLDSAVLKMEYRKYLSPETDLRTIRPYALKEFEKRWYVVAYSESAGDLRTFALDRIASLGRSGEKFRMPDGFNVDALFSSSFGIYLPEGQNPVLVKIRTTLREAAYLEDLPLHPSQMLVSKDSDSCIYAMTLIPNPGFIMELCKRGDRLEVLEPLSLRNAVKEELKNALRQYEKP
ncbi:MAG: WYL domain-containing protein [Bacteroidales bacterium]|nr:WYL domain-containing protein [Bacteroidales bacterium]